MLTSGNTDEEEQIVPFINDQPLPSHLPPRPPRPPRPHRSRSRTVSYQKDFLDSELANGAVAAAMRDVPELAAFYAHSGNNRDLVGETMPLRPRSASAALLTPMLVESMGSASSTHLNRSRPSAKSVTKRMSNLAMDRGFLDSRSSDYGDDEEQQHHHLLGDAESDQDENNVIEKPTRLVKHAGIMGGNGNRSHYKSYAEESPKPHKYDSVMTKSFMKPPEPMVPEPVNELESSVFDFKSLAGKEFEMPPSARHVIATHGGMNNLITPLPDQR